MATRTHAREAVVELLYAYSVGNYDIRKYAKELLNKKKIKNNQEKFALNLFDGIVNNLETIDKLVESNLKSWEFSKLGVIDKCIIRLGIYEAIYNKLEPPIIINEAIEVAKILGGDNTPRFVNGLLDGIIKSLKIKENHAQS